MALRCSMGRRRLPHWTWTIVVAPFVALACLVVGVAVLGR